MCTVILSKGRHEIWQCPIVEREGVPWLVGEMRGQFRWRWRALHLGSITPQEPCFEASDFVAAESTVTCRSATQATSLAQLWDEISG